MWPAITRPAFGLIDTVSVAVVRPAVATRALLPTASPFTRVVMVVASRRLEAAVHVGALSDRRTLAGSTLAGSVTPPAHHRR
jgi:hypothetical protein